MHLSVNAFLIKRSIVGLLPLKPHTFR